MDHAHVTEFASERYFEKISQQGHQGQQGHHGHQDQTAEAACALAQQQPPPHPSQFILPIRQSSATEVDDLAKHGEHKRSERGRLFSFRSKLHPKLVRPSSPTSDAAVSRASTETAKPSLPFHQLFQNLPNELQIHVISSLPLSDVLSLRLCSRFFHTLISVNESPIARHHLRLHIPAYAKRLYPMLHDQSVNLHYLCGIWHRLHVAAKLSDLMCEWITKEIFLRTTVEKRLEFAPQRERMRRRLIPLLFTIFHFFETFRDLHLKHIVENNGMGLLKEPYTMNPIEAKIMDMYDDRTLLRVHQVFPLVISSFCRRLRPPSYVGRVERSLRGYLREKPSDEVHVAILCIGGLRQVERLWEVKGYNLRRIAVDNWYNAMFKEPLEPETKRRRGMLGLGRKKSTASVGKLHATELPPVTATPGSLDGNWHQSNNPSGNLVFNTSLSAGMPMDTLGKDQLRLLLSDLPVLQKIWLETAEAVILKRRIVSRPADIKRNAQVLLDLICEDGVVEEDQWRYGTAAPESVRPNLDAIREEDAME